MARLPGILNQLRSKKILLAGDFLLDQYTLGVTRRVSPEAPVLIVDVITEEVRAGGAGNVLLNLVSLGAQVTALGRVGKDDGGEKFIDTVKKKGIDTSYILCQPDFLTPVKNRLIADRQQLLRVDRERNHPLTQELEEQIKKSLIDVLDDFSAIVLSDYGKGFLTDGLTRFLIDEGKKRSIPVIVDPKGANYLKYRGCTVIKPNRKEALEASGLPEEAPIDEHAEAILEKVEATYLLITLSEEGMVLYERGGKKKAFHVERKEVRDVTGAGDTVLAVVATGIASRLPLEEVIELANFAAGMAVEKFGCAEISLSDLAYRLIKDHLISKVFDTRHLFALKEALRGRSYIFVEWGKGQIVSSESLEILREASLESELLVISPEECSPRILDHLGSLEMVDCILVGDGIKELLEQVPPKKILKI